MSTKINVHAIVAGHVNTLCNSNTNKLSFMDFFIFFGVPIIFSVVAYSMNFQLNKDMAAIITTIASIFAGLLLNLLMLIYSVLLKFNADSIVNSDKKKLIKELYFNISYSIVICVVILAVCIFYERTVFGYDVASFLSFFFLTNLFLTILMILKRINSIFIHELKNP